MRDKATMRTLGSCPGQRGERGSAYLITLFVMVVLTIIGLSLTLVTQIEIQLGSAERTIERTYYAAESGLQFSIARALADGNFAAATQERRRSELEAGQLVEIRERVQSSPLLCLGTSPCNLCSINQGAEYSRRSLAVAVNATRFAGSGTDEVALGRKSLASGVDVEPFESLLDCLADMPEAPVGYRFDNF